MKKTLSITLLSLAIWSKALSQDMLTATIANQQIHDFQRERIRSEYENEKERLRPTKDNAKPANNVKSIDIKSFVFSPDKQISVKVKQAVINNNRLKNPRTAKALETALNNNNPFPLYVQTLKSQGLDVQHNYADAFTAYLLGMWRIANKYSSPPTAEQIRNVRKQVTETVNVGHLSNIQKQQNAEYLIYDLIFANEPYEGSRKDRNEKEVQLDSDAVYNRFLRQNKMDLRKMTITEKGLLTMK